MRPKFWSDYFEILMDFEGEDFENDPDDGGNRGDGSAGNVGTKFGIDARAHPGVDIASLTRDDAEHVYLAEYYASFAGELPAPLSQVVYDFIVNAGAGAAIKAMQRALGMGVIDGRIGPLTREAIRAQIERGQGPLIERFTVRRINFYERLADQRPRMEKFLKGWQRRALRIKRWADEKLA